MATRKRKIEEVPDWTEEDQIKAKTEGWCLIHTIDQNNPKKVFYSIGAANPANPDDKAIAYVAARIKAGDALATKATRAIFRSRAGYTTKGK